MPTSLRQIQTKLKEGSLRLPLLVDQYLKRAQEQRALNAFVEIFEEEARQQAVLVEKKILAGESGRLAGAIISIKDNICYKKHKVSAASKMLSDFYAIDSATAVERLLKEDAIILGRCNCDEFAMGSDTQTSFYGPTKNPLDPSKVPGGSSGGSASAVAANLCLASLGSDTGGSVRQPAAFCGILGLKPSYGAVSRNGLISFASSFDQIGVFAKHVDDLALILSIISGKDDNDQSLYKDYSFESGQVWRGMDRTKVASFGEIFDHEALDKEVGASLTEQLENIKGQGAELHFLSFPYLDYVLPAYYVISSAEASSNLARYDGVRYGFRAQDDGFTDTADMYIKTRSQGFGMEVKKRIILGTYVLSAGHYDSFYLKAQKVRRLITEYLETVLEAHDFIILPTSPLMPWNLDAKKQADVAHYLADIYTVIASLSGLPAISVPFAKHSTGFPISLQVIGKRFEEKKMLEFARHLSRDY